MLRFSTTTTISSLLLSWFTITSVTVNAAFDYTLKSDADNVALSITDATTGISNVKSLFINELHSVSVTGIEWEVKETATTVTNTTTSDNVDVVLFWSTLVDGIVVDTGNVSLSEAGSLLITELDVGSFIVTSNGQHTVEVILTIPSNNEAELIVSNTYQAYRPAVSIIPMMLVLIMAMTTQLVRYLSFILFLNLSLRRFSSSMHYLEQSANGIFSLITPTNYRWKYRYSLVYL